MEKGCKNHRNPERESLCMLWGNPVIFTDCGENPMITMTIYVLQKEIL